MSSRLNLGLWFLLASLTLALYAVGLDGPFVHDDWPNLYPVLGWFAHQESFSNVLFGNNSGILGRPLSVLSFMLNARLLGFDAFALKSVNLAAHLFCGGLVFHFVSVYRRQLARGSQPLFGLNIEAWVAALWLLSPMHVSTVLYTVQRMTQLSTVFVLLGLIAYLRARQEFLADAPASGMLARKLIWLPVCLLLGALSKESALLLPAFWLMLELSLGGDALRRPGIFRWLFAIFLVLPGVLLLAYVAQSDGGFISKGYASRDFDLWGRFFAQIPILLDYGYRLLNPLADRVFLFGDDFFPTGLSMADQRFWGALLVIASLLLAALALYRRSRLILFGLLFFLLGHAMESSILPLDMYYEHRNYLASVGFFLSLVGIAVVLRDTFPRWRGVASVIVLVSLISTSAYSLRAAAQVWATQQTLATYGVSHRPDSVRAQVMLSNLLLSNGDAEAAVAGLTRFMDGTHGPRALRSAGLGSVILSCQGTHVASASKGMAQYLGDLPISVLDVQLVRRLMELSLDSQCAGWGPDALREMIRALFARDDAYVSRNGLTSPVREKLEAAYLRYETEKVKNLEVCEQSNAHWRSSRQFDSGVASYMCARASCEAEEMHRIELEIWHAYSSKSNIEHSIFALFDTPCEAGN